MNCDHAIALDLVALPPGAFTMGTGPDDRFATDTERPPHAVSIAQRFALGRHPVSVAEFRVYAPAHAPDDASDLPVVNVCWHDAIAFCRWMAGRSGHAYRLPSEAEWEYACRAGTTTPFAPGEDLGPTHANFLHSEAGDRVGPGRRTPSGRHAANGFGLHDLHGNVCEWVQDRWHPDYVGAPADGSPWLGGGDAGRRVIRGGAWDYLPRLLRSGWRDRLPAEDRRDNVGFRVALSLEP